MWIIPKNLDVSVCVRDMLDSNWDLDELSQILEQCVMWRSKPLLARTWLQRLKRVNWIQHLSGRILRPLMASHFIKGYTSSLPVIPANHSLSPASEKEPQTPDTFGRILKESSRQLDLFGASSRTSQDTLQLDTQKFTEAYEIWVTKLRLDCLQRQSVVPHISANGCLSWHTIQTSNIGSDAIINKARMARLKLEGRQTGGIRNLNQVVQEQVGNWGTPKEQDSRAAFTDRGKSNLGEQAQGGLLAPDSPNMNGKSQGLWGTPKASRDGTSKETLKMVEKGIAEASLDRQVAKQGKLNPDWVEQLMGLQVGWTDLDS